MAAAAAAELAVDAGAALTTEPGAGLRKDGRKANELQPLRGELAQLARADGSMQLSHGETTVVAAVYGADEALGGRLLWIFGWYFLARC